MHRVANTKQTEIKEEEINTVMIYSTGYFFLRKEKHQGLSFICTSFKQFYSMQVYEFPTHGRQPKEDLFPFLT